MSDMANAFWNAWSKQFDVTDTTRQFCYWHVWRGWTTKLSLIKSAEAKGRARAALLLLARYNNYWSVFTFSSHSETIFEQNYQLLIDDMLAKDKIFEQFVSYFKGNYPMTTGKLWAAFGRIGSQVSCNMHIESYHRYWFLGDIEIFFRVLKQTFLNRKANRRVDLLVSILINDVSSHYEYIRNRIVSEYLYDNDTIITGCDARSCV
jgi:hypothetical protein